MRVALVHDLMMQWGGAERTLAVLASLFPDAPIYTLLIDQKMIDERFSGRIVRASFLQKLPRWVRAHYRMLLPLMPLAASRLPVGEFDLVISSSSAFAKNIRRGAHAVHVCYCHAPARFLWDDRAQYQKDNRLHPFVRFIVTTLMYPLRILDARAAKGVDIWIANSKTTQERIKRLYHKPSAVVYPPIPDLHAYVRAQKGHGAYFLAVARFSAPKKIDVIVRAFTELGLPLVVVGKGAEEAYLKSIAGRTVTFAGFVSDNELARYYAECRAFITLCDDDFGMSAVEALSFGKSVLAYRSGGVTEWMEEGKTGVFIEAQTVAAVRAGVEAFLREEDRFDPKYMQKKADMLSEKRFREIIVHFLPR